MFCFLRKYIYNDRGETFLFMQFVLRQNEAIGSHLRIPVLINPKFSKPPNYTWLVSFPHEPFSSGDQHHSGLDAIFFPLKSRSDELCRRKTCIYP